MRDTQKFIKDAFSWCFTNRKAIGSIAIAVLSLITAEVATEEPLSEIGAKIVTLQPTQG